MPVREVEVASVQIVVVAQPLAMGTRLHPITCGSWRGRRATPWPAPSPTSKELVDRGVISPIGENEPITTSKVASLEAGAGLPRSSPRACARFRSG